MAILFGKKKKRKQAEDSWQTRFECKREENARLLATLEEMRTREKEVLQTLTYVRELAQKTEAELDERFAFERGRLARYRDRWQGYLECLDTSGALYAEVKRTTQVLDGLKSEFDDIYGDEYPEEFLSERARINKLTKQGYKDIDALSDADIKKMIERMVENSSD